MVRIGEYSPNFREKRPGTEGTSNGIFGFGEYEERRKYYNEQRKLEYQQYMAQQALKPTSSQERKNKSQVPTADAKVLESCTRAEIIPTSVRREVGTQTIHGEKQDASTNTDTDVGIQGNLEQDSKKGLAFLMKEKDGRRVNSVTAAYERELRAQIQEKKNRVKELERIEQQEAESRERWLVEEATRELERRAAEEKRIKAVEDCRMQRLEEFCNRSQQLQREAKERRRMTIRNQKELAYFGTESDGIGKSYIPGESCNKTSPSKLLEKRPVVKPQNLSPKCVLSQKSEQIKLRRDQCDAQGGNLQQDSFGQEVLKTTSTADEAIPNISLPSCYSRDDRLYPNSSTVKNNSNILSHLGEIRRQLATQQMKMEEALKKTKSPNKTV